MKNQGNLTIELNAKNCLIKGKKFGIKYYTFLKINFQKNELQLVSQVGARKNKLRKYKMMKKQKNSFNFGEKMLQSIVLGILLGGLLVPFVRKSDLSFHPV
jgi:hypothetical protein